MIKISKFNHDDKKWVYEAEYHFFALLIFGFMIKFYYSNWYFDMQIGTRNKGIKAIIATEKGYERIYG